MAADGLIVLGLDVAQTQANIQTELDSILNNSKTKKIILTTAIEQAETDKQVNAIVAKLNKKTAKIGIAVDAKNVNNILAAQQKIASTQAKLNSQMQEYRNTAKEVGVTLNKDTWNTFNHAVSSGDFTKATEILRSAKKQIAEYNAAVGKMNSDTSVSRSVSSIVEQFNKLKNVSAETQNRVNLLKASFAQFENADSTQKKLSAYKRLQTMMTQLKDELYNLSSAEKVQASDLGIKKKLDDARSSLEIFKAKYSEIGDSSTAQKVTDAISALETALNNVDSTASGGKLAKQWDDVSVAINNAKRAVAEYNAAQSPFDSLKTRSENISGKIDNVLSNIEMTGLSGFSLDALTSKLNILKEQATSVQNTLENLDPSDAEDVKRLTENIAQVEKAFNDLKSDTKAFKNPLSSQQLVTNIEKAKQKVEEYGKKYSAIKSRPELAEEWEKLVEKASKISTEVDLKKFNTEFERFKKKVEEAGAKTASFGDKLKSAFKYITSFFSATKIITFITTQLKQMVANVTALDSAMVELRKVTEASDAEFDQFLSRAKTKAVDLGSTVTDLVNSTADFSRLGFSLKEAEELAQVATIYKNVGDDINSIDDSSSIIVTAMKAFNIEAEDAISIVDKLNKIGNNFAISSGDLGEGLTRAASYMYTAGNTIDQTLAMLTAMTEITQDASASGNALKILAMRLRGAKTEIIDAGESTDGMAESTSKLREDILALTNVTGKGGFDIMLNDDEFKSTYDILKGISEVWNDMSNVNQAALIELIAGKQRGNAVSALLTSMAQAEKVLTTSINSAGSAMEEQAIWLDSIEAKTNQFKASFEALSSTVVNSDLIKFIIDSGTTAITVLDGIFKSFGGVGSALLNISSIIVLLNVPKALSNLKEIGKIVSKFTGFKRLFSTVTGGFSRLTSAWHQASESGEGFIKTLTKTISTLYTSASAAQIATASIAAIIVVLTAAFAIYQKYQQVQQEKRDNAIEAAEAAKEEMAAINELYQSYQKAYDAYEDNKGSKEELENATDALLKKLGYEGDAVNSLIEKYGTLDNAIRNVTIQALEGQWGDLIAGLGAAEGNLLNAVKGNWFTSNQYVNTSIGNENKTANVLAKAGLIPDDYNANIYLGDNTTLEGTLAIYEKLLAMRNELERAARNGEGGLSIGALIDDKLYNNIVDKINDMKESVEEYQAYVKDVNETAAQISVEKYLLGNDSPSDIKSYLALRQKMIADALNSESYYGDYEDRVNAIDNYLQTAFDHIYSEYASQEQRIQGIIDGLIPNNIDKSELEDGLASGLHKVDEYTSKVVDLKEKLNTLSDEDLSIAYDLISVPDNGIQSWDALIQAIADYKQGVSDIIPPSQELKKTITTLWNSEDFADTKKNLSKVAQTIDGITANTITELAKKSDELAEFLEQDGMNAQFLAHILQTELTSGNGFDLITDDALNLNKALDGITSRFSEVISAKKRYDDALSGGEKDDDFKSYADATKTLQEQIDKGFFGSNKFWSSAEFIFGKDKLKEWGWSDGIDEIISSMPKVNKLFGDAESAGQGFLDYLYEISDAGEIKASDGSILATIEKLADGTYNLNFDENNLDGLAEAIGLTSEATIAIIEALAMWGDFDFYDIENVLKEIQKMGLSSDSFNGTAINAELLRDQLVSLGRSEKYIDDLFDKLQNTDDITLVDITSNVDELTKSLSDLNIATQDGTTIKINVDGLAELMSKLNYTKDDAESLINKLSEADNITLTNVEGGIVDVQGALDKLNDYDFATLETNVDGVKSNVSEVDSSTTSNVVSEIGNIGTAADAANTKLNTVNATLTRIDGRTITVTMGVKTKPILGFAKGTDGAPGGASLVGEEGEELVQSKNKAYFVGTNGPEIVDLNKGDRVFTANQTRKIKRNAKLIRGTIPAFAGGTGLGKKNNAGISQGISSSASSKNTSSGSSDNSSSESEFERLYKHHQHLLNMNQESDEDYLRWLNKAYKDAYAKNEIELDDFNKYQEEVYKGFQDLFKDYLNDIEHEISMRENYDGESKKIISMYRTLIAAVEKEIKDARALGLDDTDDYVQNLQSKWQSYKDAIKDIEDEINDNVKDALEKLVDYQKDIIKQDIENQKDALDKKLDYLKEFYDKQKEMLQDQYDEEKYLEEQSEKRKSVSDIQAQLSQLEFDNSAWAQKRKAELQKELADAQGELDDFEKQHALELALDALENSYDEQEAQIQKQIDALDEELNDPELMFNKALLAIQENTGNLYQQMLEYNRKYGTGNDADVKDVYEEAYKSLLEYKKLYGKDYEGVTLSNETGYKPNTSWDTASVSGTNPSNQKPQNNANGSQQQQTSKSATITKGSSITVKNTATHFSSKSKNAKMASFVPGGTYTVYQDAGNEVLIGRNGSYTGWINKTDIVGYSSGTENATAGLHEVNELGSEYVFTSKDGHKYRILNDGDKVLDAKATKWLYQFANSYGRMYNDIRKQSATNVPIQNNSKNFNNEIVMGDIIVRGNADQQTVSAIRREQRSAVEYMLKEFSKLNK